MTYIFKANGMMCEGCVNNVKKAMNGIEGVTDVNVDLSTCKVTVEANKEISESVFKTAVLRAGYRYEK